MADEPQGAPGPIDPQSHIDPSGERSDRPTDARAVDLERQREAEREGRKAVPVVNELEQPSLAILLTEVQEIKERVDLIGAVGLAMVFLSGILVGVAVFEVVKKIPVDDVIEGEVVEDGN